MAEPVSATSRAIAGKVRWRLALPCILFMLMSSLDRANISFAAASMNAELGFSPSQYGFGAGVLFVGFLLGQYPSLWWLQKVGMRGWIASCALLWGMSAGAMGFIETHTQFYVLRILIGFAEGGLAPGIVFYLSQFATERERARTFTMPMLAIPLSVIIGAPLSGWLLGMSQELTLASWRFMFIAEAVPTLLLGVVALFYFPDSTTDARWLDRDEKDWLAQNAARRATSTRENDWSVSAAAADRDVGPAVVLPAVRFLRRDLLAAAGHPVIDLADTDADRAGGRIAVGRRCDRDVWQRHAFGSQRRALLAYRAARGRGGAGIAAGMAGGPGGIAVLALFVAGLGLGSAQGAFWALPTQLLSPAAMGVAVVAINIAGSAGGLVMPHLMGLAREHSGGFTAPTWLVVAMLAGAAVLVAAIRYRYRREFAAIVKLQKTAT